MGMFGKEETSQLCPLTNAWLCTPLTLAKEKTGWSTGKFKCKPIFRTNLRTQRC